MYMYMYIHIIYTLYMLGEGPPKVSCVFASPRGCCFTFVDTRPYSMHPNSLACIEVNGNLALPLLNQRHFKQAKNCNLLKPLAA